MLPTDPWGWVGLAAVVFASYHLAGRYLLPAAAEGLDRLAESIMDRIEQLHRRPW